MWQPRSRGSHAALFLSPASSGHVAAANHEENLINARGFDDNSGQLSKTSQTDCFVPAAAVAIAVKSLLRLTLRFAGFANVACAADGLTWLEF
jgi:hypothetical protein